MSTATIALGEDWNTFRLQLIANIDKLGTFADTSAKTYSGADDDLARQIHGLFAPPRPRPHGLIPVAE